jgi:phosphatidylserine decarboxylase
MLLPNLAKMLKPAVLLSLFIFLAGCSNSHKNLIRDTPDHAIIFAPADGVISAILDIPQGDIPVIEDAGKKATLSELSGFLPDKTRLILIFMNPLNYHGVISPIDGTVVLSQHTPGKFQNLYGKTAYLENERMTIVIDGRSRIVIIPIAGFLYRRIVTKINPGDMVTRGQHIGSIQMGSAVAVILPQTSSVLVKKGDRVRVGKTPIARLSE